MKQSLFDAVALCNSDEVHAILRHQSLSSDVKGFIFLLSLYSVLSLISTPTKKRSQLDECLLLFVNEVCEASCFDHSAKKSISYNRFDIIYMLLDAGADIDKTDKEGNSSLYIAALKENGDLCDILLQCGADMWIPTEHGISVYEYISQMTASPDIVNVFNKFYPGLWKAVECENIYQVRQLINYWCRTNLQKNGLLLKDIALETGNEEIINLILGICESMDLVYHIFAKNTQAVKKKLEMHRKKLRLNLRKMSDHGAPILYYLIQCRDVLTIQLFIENDCQIYTIMQDEMGNDMPVLFSAMRSDMTVNVLEALLPEDKRQLEEILYKILYKGKTVLQVAMEKGVSKEIFKLLVNRGGPLLLSDRNEFNQTVRDIAVSLNWHVYVSAIDECVHDWIVNSVKYIKRREKLAFFGWKFEQSQYMENKNLNEDVSEFLSELNLLQAQIKDLNLAIENGDISKLTELKTANHLSHFKNMDLLWYSRVMGDGIPLLHRAVLHNQPEIVEMILDEKPMKESIDNLFDQHHRTALHYAFACSYNKKIQKLLLYCGCSEHVLDKNNKEPLDFRDKQDTLAIFQLLKRLKLKNFSDFEPDPWSNISIEDHTSYCKETKSVVDSTHSNLYHSCDCEKSLNYETECDIYEHFESNMEEDISEEEEGSRSQCCIF